MRPEKPQGDRLSCMVKKHFFVTVHSYLFVSKMSCEAAGERRRRAFANGTGELQPFLQRLSRKADSCRIIRSAFSGGCSVLHGLQAL